VQLAGWGEQDLPEQTGRLGLTVVAAQAGQVEACPCIQMCSKTDTLCYSAQHAFSRYNLSMGQAPLLV
jgi:hypothetical protein